MILRKENLRQLIHNRKRSFAAIVAISAVASTLSLAAPVSLSVASVHNAKPVKNQVEVAFNQKQTVVQLVSKNAVIVPGESKVQREEREAREKAEAEAQAAAQAAAQAKEASELASRSVSRRVSRVYVDPSDFDSIYQRAQSVYGVDWRILKAIHYVETGCSGSTSKSSYSGAVGPMQFIPSTWNAYGVDGNGDGISDITNVEDAIFTAARYLCACGYPDVARALYGYNPSTYYYYKVMDVAQSLGY